jgi:hypothetical protein
MPFIQRGGVPGGLPDREVDPDLDAELAQELGLCRPWGHGPRAGYCPEVTEYGRGLTLTAVHGRTRCERWDTARAARLAEREAGS